MKTIFIGYDRYLPIRKIILVIFSLVLTCNIIKAQVTGTYTVLQQPCNNDGKFAIQILSGMTPPFNYHYYQVDGGYQVHTNVNSMYDTLFAASSAINFIYVTPSLGSGSLYYYTSVTGMVQPFTVDPPVITNAICPSLTGTAAITINSGTSPASVQWYTNTGAGVGSYVGTGNPITLPAGQYAAIVTDAAGCTVTEGADSSGIHIYHYSGINFSFATTTASCTNGTAGVTGISGGVTPYTFLWENGATSSSISGLTQGYYGVTVTDAQGCYTNGSATVSQSINVNVNTVPTAATCLQNDGSLMSFGSGGTPPYTYAYSNGMSGQTISGISGETNLYITATDANGCIGSGYAYIGTSTPITVTYSSTNSSCLIPTGSITLSIAGGTSPYTVDWNGASASTSASISGLSPGSYYFIVTDAVGCKRTGYVTINPSSTMTSSVYAINPVCPATTGTVGVTVTGSAPPFSYLWSTGATTLTVSGVSAGSYSCTITDNVGCSQIRYTNVFPTSPINIGLSSTPASCIYTSDGNILANATGGSAPYTYAWSNGQTTANATGLAAGYYVVSVQDANGCHAVSYPTLGYNPSGTSCYCTITGKVFNDLNGNCIFDSGEQGIHNIMMHCSGQGYVFTDANGDYSFRVPTGSYTISETVQYQYPLSACQSNAIPVSVTASSGCVSTVNFSNSMSIIHDIHVIRTNLTAAVPGTTYTSGLIVQNDGTVPESNIQLGYTHDGQLSLSSISPNIYSQLSPGTLPNWYSVNSGYPTTAPGSSSMIYFSSVVPTTVPLGTDIVTGDTTSYTSPMNNWLNDYTPWNNVHDKHTTVIGSYDPNFKEVFPQGTGSQGYITVDDSVLDYVVHFQNTGSYYANKVVVVDTLDNDLDWNSVRPGFADHDYTASISENGVLTFTFDNIHLDWESNNDLASRGLVTYSVKQKPNLAVGTQIKNNAAIYFDYNAPVITNQTVNTIQAPDGIGENEKDNSFVIYPNPATNELNLVITDFSDATAVFIYDLQGRMVQSNAIAKNSTGQTISVQSLVSGIYFITVENTNKERVTKKFIKN